MSKNIIFNLGVFGDKSKVQLIGNIYYIHDVVCVLHVHFHALGIAVMFPVQCQHCYCHVCRVASVLNYSVSYVYVQFLECLHLMCVVLYVWLSWQRHFDYLFLILCLHS